MFDYASIKKLTCNDTIILNSLVPLAEQAKEAEKQIKETYLFHIGEDKIELWHDDYNHEYLTRDGVWQARFLHQTYDVECTAETIFEYMKAEYFIQNGFTEQYEGNRYTEDGEKAFIFRYFKSFLKRTEEKYAKANNEK